MTNEPASHAARRAEAHEARAIGTPDQRRTLVASSTFDALIGTRDELRRELDAALDRAKQAESERDLMRAKLGDATADAVRHAREHHAEQSEKQDLEALLDVIAPDWRCEHNCPACEDRIALPDHEVCSGCEARAEGVEQERAQDRWEDRS